MLPFNDNVDKSPAVLSGTELVNIMLVTNSLAAVFVQLFQIGIMFFFLLFPKALELVTIPHPIQQQAFLINCDVVFDTVPCAILIIMGT